MLVLDTDTLPPSDRVEAFHHGLTDDSVPNEVRHEQPRRACAPGWRCAGSAGCPS
ncbi:hypothetical protein ACFQ0B_01315 [Nonomuraea thailandensis]